VWHDPDYGTALLSLDGGASQCGWEVCHPVPICLSSPLRVLDVSDGVLALILQVISSGWKATERRLCCLVRQVGTVHRSAPTIAAEYIGPDALGPDDPAMFKITIGEDSAPAPVFFFFDSSFVALIFHLWNGPCVGAVGFAMAMRARARTHTRITTTTAYLPSSP